MRRATDDELIKTIEELRQSALEWQKSSMQALGFNQIIEYNRIRFHVSERCVIADLAPLAYLDLVQEIEDGMVHAAVASLYERLASSARMQAPVASTERWRA